MFPGSTAPCINHSQLHFLLRTDPGRVGRPPLPSLHTTGGIRQISKNPVFFFITEIYLHPPIMDQPNQQRSCSCQKSYDDFSKWVKFVYWWRCIRKGLPAASEAGFSKNLPSGTIFSIGQNVRPCVRLFTFELPFKRLFAPTYRSRKFKIFTDAESLGKSNRKKLSQI